ncbi:MAG: SGNH/GDSL hydrolase family protein [Planctomycetota bacterium]|nr:SGNH/GDSL hydrolase family protein [Planctomycetota bacterium]
MQHVLSSRYFYVKIPAILSCSILYGLFGLTANTLAAEKGKPAERKISRILFLGNSITKHGPAPHIGWTGDWGMAASALDKDYVHVVARSLADKNGKAPEVMAVSIAAFERKFGDYEVAKNLNKALEFKPDTIVMAIGENVSPLKTKQSQAIFKSRLLKLLAAFRADNNPAIIIRSSFWPDKVQDDIFKQCAMEVGGTYVDISSLCKDESNYARSERDYKHAGVAAHPGDKGMKAIAEAILKAMNN